MPSVTRWFIKTGIIYFIASVVLALASEIPALDAGPMLLPVYWHMMVVGWITQIIMGVSIWMFPRKHRDNKRREALLTWSAYGLLNAGLIMRFVMEPFLPLIQQSTWVTALAVTSSLLQVIAISCYIAEIWPRLQFREQRTRART
jgi:hypothetical protein